MNDTLIHHGILGQKWGVRRYQNKDGTLTSAGKKRYGDDDSHTKEGGKAAKGADDAKAVKGVAIGAAVVAGTVLTAYLVKKYGGKNVSDMTAAADSGKAALEKVLKNSMPASTSVSQVSAPKVEPQKLIEQAVRSAPITKFSTTSIPKASVSTSSPYDFSSLMKQNQDLLEKMYAELT